MKHGWSGMEPPTLPALTPSGSLLASKGTDLALERKTLGFKVSNQGLPQLLFFHTAPFCEDLARVLALTASPLP